MQRRRVLVWLGAAAVLATAVIALRETQPVGPPLPAGPSRVPSGPTTVARFAADGVGLPEPTESPAAPAAVHVSTAGSGRVRVAWGAALPGGSSPANAVGYEVRWSSMATGAGGTRLVAAPELELRLDARTGGTDGHAIEVRSVDAFGRRSAPTVATAVAAVDAWDPRRLTGLAEPFDGPFSVDTGAVGARWHLSGSSGCTSAAAEGGMLAVDLECGADLAVLRARSPMRLVDPPGGPDGAGRDTERGRIVVVTDAAGPSSALVVDLVPGPADRVGASRGTGMETGAVSDGGAALDPALPDGALRIRIDDGGARVFTGAGVPRLPGFVPASGTTAPVRGVGVLHTYEVVIGDTGLRVSQDGVPVAAAGVRPPWTEAHLLIGFVGPPGRQARVRVDAVGFTGPAVVPPASYALPVVPATQRLLGVAEVAPGIGISRRPLSTAASARLVATVNTMPGVDLGGLVVQHGDVSIPGRPVLPTVPARPGAEVTVAAEIPAGLLGPDGPAAVSPLVFRAPGAEFVTVPVSGSYLEIVPLDIGDVPAPAARVRPARSPAPAALPRPSVRLLDSESREVTTAAPATRLVVEVVLDGLGGQLEAASLTGAAGFQLWMDNRQIASVPTAVDGPGVGGVYRVGLSTRLLSPGAHFIELRLIAVDPAVKPVSALVSWQLS